LNFFKKFEKINYKNSVFESEIKRKIANVRSLLLEVSEACNLRCRYCVYSGKFLDRRKHSTKLMSWNTAKESINFFFNWIFKNERYRYHPYLLRIGFYGGEPLLNFPVIEKSVFYSKELLDRKKANIKNAQLGFGMTTNGLLLDKNILNFLIKNDFQVTFSLDGPEEVHDKNKGEGSFKKLYKKILYIYKEHPEYFKKKVSFSIVYAKDTDLKVIKDFFSQDIFEKCAKLEFGYVVDAHSTFKFPEYGMNEKRVMEEIKKKKIKGLKLSKIEEEILKVYFSIMINTLIIKRGNYGAACTLGSKLLFIRTNGEFYGCEKTGESFRIGDLKNGFNLERIKEIEKEWQDVTSLKCKDCIVLAFCTACIASTGFNGKIELMNFCKNTIKRFRERISEYIEFQKI